MKGISTNKKVSAEMAACLRNNGIGFVARYYSATTQQPQKRITLAEAQSLSAAGLTVVTVYEDGPTSDTYFSTQRGEDDGHNAFAYAQSLPQAADSAIYFAVDYDAGQAAVAGAIADYFRGVQKGIQEAGAPSTDYRIGVYGSGYCCQWLRENLPFVEFAWLAESTGWLGSRSYTGWNIKQSGATGGLCGLSAGDWESNESQGAYGGFTVNQRHTLRGAAPSHAPEEWRS